MESASIVQNTLTNNTTIASLPENAQNMETVPIDQNTLSAAVTATLTENTLNMEAVSIDQNNLPVNTTIDSLPEDAQNVETVPIDRNTPTVTATLSGNTLNMVTVSIDRNTLTTIASLPENAQNVETVPIDQTTITATVTATLSENTQNMETVSIDQNTLPINTTIATLPENAQNRETVPIDQNTLTAAITDTLSENTKKLETVSIDQNTIPVNTTDTLSKNAQKKLVKQQRYEAKKAMKKAMEKEERKKEGERKRKEWEEKLASVDEEERKKIIESRKSLRKERMDQRNLEKGERAEKLKKAKEFGQNVVLDLEFAHLMAPNEIHSLVQQIMFCYAVNGKSTSPCHLWLTGCDGEMETQLKKVPGFYRWIIEKKKVSYIEALQDKKDKLVYLTADAETVLEELDETKIYIVGGLVDRNRWKGITMKKANEQGIQTAKLPIGNYLKMASSQVLTVNQVIEILLKYLETKDWKEAFFNVIPQRKRFESESKQVQQGDGEQNHPDDDPCENKKLKLCT